MERDGGREEAEQQFENLSIIQSSGRKISHKDESKVGKLGIKKVAGSHRTGSRDWKAPKKGKQRLVRGRGKRRPKPKKGKQRVFLLQ